MKAFITGSHAYGKPTEKSDIDLVIRCDFSTRMLLEKMSDSKETIRFGKLNVICAGDDTEMAVWKLGTAAMEREVPGHGPFDKQASHARLEKLREMVGIEYQGSDPREESEQDEEKEVTDDRKDPWDGDIFSMDLGG